MSLRVGVCMYCIMLVKKNTDLCENRVVNCIFNLVALSDFRVAPAIFCFGATVMEAGSGTQTLFYLNPRSRVTWGAVDVLLSAHQLGPLL